MKLTTAGDLAVRGTRAKEQPAVFITGTRDEIAGLMRRRTGPRLGVEGDVVVAAPGEVRAAMVRLVVAQQWAAFVAVMGCEIHAYADGRPLSPLDGGPDDWNAAVAEAERALAQHPCAIDVVADLLGEAR